jgi:ectoine hydroxylase
VKIADVLSRAPLVLDQRRRERYVEDGYLVVPGHVPPAWLARLRAVVAHKIEESRALTASDDQFDLAPDHTAEKPNIRRLRKAVDQHPELWAFATDRTVVDLVADLLGPDLRFHSGKLNFKWSAGGDAVRWHQDIQAWPHTSFSVLTFATLRTGAAVELGGPAGTVVLLDCRVVHGSAANDSPRMRPLLLYVYASADTLPISPAPAPTTKTGVLVRGQEPRYVHMEPYPARLPPRWDQVGYRSIFAAQSTAAYAE